MPHYDTTEDFSPIEGLQIGEAFEKMSQNGIVSSDGSEYDIRIVKEDGVQLMVTQDIRTDRINVELDGGVIAQVYGVG